MVEEQTELDEVTRITNLILSTAVDDRCTVIHIDPQAETTLVRFRVDNQLHEVMKVPPHFHRCLSDKLKSMADMDVSERRVPQNGRLHFPVQERKFIVDVSTYPCVQGEKLVLHIHEEAAPLRSLNELGLSAENLEKVDEVLSGGSGLLLFAGGSRSGRKTSLYACLEKLRQGSGNIFTIEDTVIHKLEGVNQIQLNPRCGLQGPTALRSVMKGDPDVIVVEAMVTREMTRLVLEAYRPGRLILASCDCEDAAHGVMFLLHTDGESYPVAKALRGIVAQRLLPKLCEGCRQSVNSPAGVIGLPEGTTVYQAEGCQECRKAGSRGLVGVHEVLINSDATQEAILRFANLDEFQGFVDRPLRQDALDKLKAGLIGLDDFVRAFPANSN